MTFADLAVGVPVFLDANVLVYHFSADPVLGPSCNALMRHIDAGEIDGFTSAHVLSEAAHRLMAIEASATFGWPFAGMVRRLRKHSAEVRTLAGFQRAVQTVISSRVQVVSVTPGLVLEGTIISRQTGLLSNDALIVAAMHAHRLTNLASHDSDFDRVPGLVRYAPV